MTTLEAKPAAATTIRTFNACAAILYALAPEVLGVSFHGRDGDPLWLSEDFLPPEDHQLIEESLALGRGTVARVDGALRGGGRHIVVIPLRIASGEICGAVRLSLDPQSDGGAAVDPLEMRLSALLVCLSAEIERAGASPRGAPVDPARRTQLEQALRAEDYELFLQPIRSLRLEEVAARYEVLPRLRMPDRSLVEPQDFLNLATELNLLVAIDRWVVRKLLAWMLSHRLHWARSPTVFAVNVSVHSLLDANFVDFVDSCLTKSRIPPQALCFEITERSASSGNPGIAAAMKRLEALGCEVALDHFGATSPGFAYLRDVPANYFKIDGSLVTAAPGDRVATAMISGIVQMASALGVQTMAGCVESDAELDALRTLGVDYVQGHLLGRPEALAGYAFETTMQE